jgi:hypothetical protein
MQNISQAFRKLEILFLSRIDTTNFNVMATEMYEKVPPSEDVQKLVIAQMQMETNYSAISAKYEAHVKALREQTSETCKLMRELEGRNTGEEPQEMAHIEEYLTLKKKVDFSLVNNITGNVSYKVNEELALWAAFLKFLKITHEENCKFFTSLITEYTTSIDVSLIDGKNTKSNVCIEKAYDKCALKKFYKMEMVCIEKIC